MEGKIQKGRVRERETSEERERERGEKEGQTGRWRVLWREGVFMSGCRRHSGTPSKRKPSLLQSAREERERAAV